MSAQSIGTYAMATIAALVLATVHDAGARPLNSRNGAVTFAPGGSRTSYGATGGAAAPFGVTAKGAKRTSYGVVSKSARRTSYGLTSGRKTSYGVTSGHQTSYGVSGGHQTSYGVTSGVKTPYGVMGKGCHSTGWGIACNPFSDARLKRDIVLLGRLDNGLGLYRYRYRWDEQVYVGVMAQEVAAVAPDAVSRDANGFRHVNYRRLGLRMQTWEEWVTANRLLANTAN